MKKVMKNSFLTYVVFAVGGFSLQTGISTQAIECTPDVYQVVKMDSFEIIGIGDGAVPPAELVYADALVGKVYVEMVKNGFYATKAFVEFYAGVAEDSVDCRVSGKLINQGDDGPVKFDTIFEHDNYNVEYEPQNQDECFPRTKNGAVVAVEFTFANPFYANDDTTIWYPNEDANEDGMISFCVRVGYKETINDVDEVISFLDIKIRGNLDISATFNSVGAIVPITLEQATKFETEIECTINVDAFLCGTDEENQRIANDESYGLGQSFRICVDVPDTDNNFGNYKVTGFNSIVCKNNIVNRTLITVDGSIDPLTSINTTVTGLKNLEGSSTATVNAAAVESVVTSIYFGKEVASGEFNCGGEVELKYVGTGESGGCKLVSPPSPSPPSGPPSRCIDLCSTQRESSVAVPKDANIKSLVASLISGTDNTKQTYGEVINCWNISLVTSLNQAFMDQKENQFNEPLDCWDTQSITNMEYTFANSKTFNQDISEAFNQDISGWNVGSVTTMHGMFSRAYAFNSDINAWNVGSVTMMLGMFYSATVFNQNLSGWNVNSVTTMNQMFRRATVFNSDINTWNVGSVTAMQHMFFEANAFNSGLSEWDVSSVTNMFMMFYSARNFNQDLCKWSFPMNIINYVPATLRMFHDSNCGYKSDPTAADNTHGCLSLCKHEDGSRRLGINNNIITVNNVNNNNNSNNNSNKINNRVLQEGGGDAVAPFVTTIKISTTTTVNVDSAASVPFCRRIVVIATLAVATVGFFLSLMVIM